MHALTTGAIGVMTLAVMTRASLGHTGRPGMPVLTVCIYVLVTIGAMCASIRPGTGLPTNYRVGCGCGELEWRLSVVRCVYGPYLLRPNNAE